jgi:hypothetical protein
MMFQEIDDMFIKQDIADLNERIATARRKLEELPATAPTWPSRKKLNAKRQWLRSEITHLRHLIEIAESSLETEDAV